MYYNSSNSPKFGDALFERSIRFRSPQVSTTRIERLNDPREALGSFYRRAEVLAKRAEKDFYDPSGRMPKNEAALPHIIDSASRERELRAEHLDQVRRNTAKPSVIRKAKIQLELVKLKLANARLAQSSSDPTENQSAITTLRSTLRRLDELGYANGNASKVAPTYVHALANSGAFSLSHAVHDYTKKDFGSVDMAIEEKIFEGMAVAPHTNRYDRTQTTQNMEAELPELQRAIDMTPRMKTSATNSAFAKVGYSNLKAEAFHALAHYYGQYSNQEAFAKNSQNARKAVKLANEALQTISQTDLTPEHARMSYNLNKKATHLCSKHEPHAPSSYPAQELCGAIKLEDFPQNIRTLEQFPSFDPSYMQIYKDPEVYKAFS